MAKQRRQTARSNIPIDRTKRRTLRVTPRAMEDAPNQQGRAEPGQSEKVQELAREQKSYLDQARIHNEEEAAKSRREDKTNEEER